MARKLEFKCLSTGTLSGIEGYCYESDNKKWFLYIHKDNRLVRHVTKGVTIFEGELESDKRSFFVSVQSGDYAITLDSFTPSNPYESTGRTYLDNELPVPQYIKDEIVRVCKELEQKEGA